MRGELRCHVACCTEGSIVKHVEIFPNCTRRLAWINRAGVPFDARRGALLIGIRRDQAGINRKVLTTDQPLGDAALENRLENLPQQITVAEAPMPVLRECRVVGNAIGKIEPTEPPICQVQMNLFAQPPFRPDPQALSDQQHPDHQFRIDRWPSRRTVERRQMRANA